MAEPRVIQGTLDLLVLTAVSVAPTHGYGIGQWIAKNTDGELEIDEGALYHSVHRLARKGLLDAEWRPSETGRRAKFYSLTAAGRAHLAREEAQWTRYSGLVTRIMDAGRAEAEG